MKPTTAIVTALAAAAMAAFAPTPAEAQSCPDTYQVRPGDWLSKIAQRCGVEVETISALNPELDPNRIEIGQPIMLRKPDPVQPVFDLRIPLAAMPPAPPQKGRVRLEAEVTGRSGACLQVTDAAGRSYSFPAGDTELQPGAWVDVSGEVVDNWFCASGAEILVETVAPVQAERMAGLEGTSL